MSSSGPKPNFDRQELMRALRVIEKKGPIGRKRLTEELDLGEGSVRTVLGRLKKQGLVVSTHRGHEPTERGEKKIEDFPEIVSLDAGALTVGEKDVATVVKAASSRIGLGIEERDEAIKAGAEGATVLVFEDNDLVFPGGNEMIDSGVKTKILDSFALEEGDVIIIGTGQTRKEAEKGVLAAVESLTE